MKRKSIRWLGSVPALAAIVALGASSGGAAASPKAGSSAALPNCVPAKNIEAIIDDSDSMDSSDPFNLRRSLVEILAGNPLNKGKQMAGVEFGNTAGPVFPLQTIGSNAAQASISASLGAVAGNGFAAQGSATNYQNAFTAGNTQNPNADVRIFLTDGVITNGPNPPTSYKTPLTKTLVVGFDTAASSGVALLNTIAAETGGKVFLPTGSTGSVEASGLLKVAGEIKALLNCRTVDKTFVDNFTRIGQTKNHAFRATGRTAELLISWPDPSVKFVGIISNRSPSGTTATVAKVKKTVQKGTTFQAVHLKGLKKKKKYKFKVKSKVQSIPVTVTSQVIG